MGFTNSSLVNYKKISPNKSSREGHKIDTISIHCVVGQCSVETLGNVFSDSSKQASSNYGIGYDGKIGMYVEEKDRSWCTSSKANDIRAITIEVASDTTHPYKVNNAAYKSLINLLADICKRNGIKKLLWKGDKSLIGQVDKQNMTVHRWFANKSCPGDYLYNLHPKIAEEVNKRLITQNEQEEDEVTRYRNINDIPEGYREETKELIDLGFNGYSDERGLYVTEDMLRTMIINLRMCKALIKTIPSIDEKALFEEFKKNLNLEITVK